MAIRITQQQLSGAFASDLQSIQSRIAHAQRQATTGQRIIRPSDDPDGTARILGYDRQLADLERYRANVADSSKLLDSADSALETVSSALQRVRELTTQAASSTTSAGGRSAIAGELAQLKDVIRGALNTRHGDVFVFAGTATNAAPFATNAYAGTASSMTRRIGEGETVEVTLAGDAVLGPSGTNTLDMLDQLVTDVNANNLAGVQGALAAFDTHFDRALDARTKLGAVAARLELADDRLARTQERVLSARSDVADVDTAEAYMRFTQQQSTYQAALAAGTRMMQTSILDFL